MPLISMEIMLPSAKRVVARDKKSAEHNMSYAAAKSYELLESLARHEYRGRGDTWEAARNRAASKAKVQLSYAHRLWHRWKTMKDASGDVLLLLQDAYERSCERHEEKAREYRAEREALNALDTGSALAPVRTGQARMGKEASKGPLK